jgi:branched-chain amino acid aminotransferase
VARAQERLPKDKLVFGHSFTDHMLEIDWTKQDGWGAPRITPYHDFVLSPAASALHYALQCFEGMKAYKDTQGRIRLFRPDCNLARLNHSMTRLYMPNFDEAAFMECIKCEILPRRNVRAAFR